MDGYATKEKVVTYITRQRNGQVQVLVFDHVDMPEAGTQVPAGTVEPGEQPEVAALREACEEAGLCNLTITRYLGRCRWVCEERREIHWRSVFHLESPEEVADEWIHVVHGHGEDEGMRFRCFWLDAQAAAGALVGDQGAYLAYLPT